MRSKFKLLFIISLALVISYSLFAAPQTKCPVLDGPIDKKVFVDYKGKRVYFCCAGCEKEFNKDPNKYLKKMEADGVKLENTPKSKR